MAAWMVAACGDEATPTELLRAVPQSAAQDTIRCPRDHRQFPYCAKASSSQIQTLYNQTNLFASAQGCQKAKNGIQGLLTQNGGDDVYIGLGDAASAEISWTKESESGGPPYDGVALVVSEEMFSSGHIDAGNLRWTLYHEGGHLWGYVDEDSGTEHALANDFADTCKNLESDPAATSIDNTGGGDQNTDGQWVWCTFRTWYDGAGNMVKEEMVTCWIQ